MDSKDVPLIVIVDDEQAIVEAITRCFMRLDAKIESFTSPRLAVEFIKDNQPDIVISDQMMPDIKGNELLAQVKELWPSTKRILLSAYQDFDVVIEAFNQQSIDQFISKPWKNADLQALVIQSAKQNKGPLASDINSIQMIGSDSSMVALFEKITLAANANVPIFISGETGTGKELVANACHQLSSACNGNFIAFNCANFSEHLIESQLFGHKKGAFTGADKDHVGLFESADGGTIFLDEVTTLPLSLQSKLLRVLQERNFSPLGSLEVKPFDAQVISASSTKLTDAVASGQFREDLFYRLNVIQLNLPALRERGEDVRLLAEHFLARFNMQLNASFTHFSEQAIALLMAHQWPGNVRQLENVLHGTMAINQGRTITKEMLQEMIIDAPNANEQQQSPVFQPSHSASIQPLQDIERQAIERAIDSCDGNITKAAAMLEVNPSTIYRKMKNWQ